MAAKFFCCVSTYSSRLMTDLPRTSDRRRLLVHLLAVEEPPRPLFEVWWHAAKPVNRPDDQNCGLAHAACSAFRSGQFPSTVLILRERLPRLEHVFAGGN